MAQRLKIHDWEAAIKAAPDNYSIVTYVRRFDHRKPDGMIVPRERVWRREIWSKLGHEDAQCLYGEDMSPKLDVVA